MKRKEKIINKIMDAIDITEFGFDERAYDLNYDSLGFRRKINDKVDRIGMGFTFEGKKISLGVFSPSITFPEVNQTFIDANYLELIKAEYHKRFNYTNEYFMKRTSTISNFPGYISQNEKFYSLNKNLLDSRNRLDEEKMEKVCKEYRTLFQKHIFPFFDMVPDLQTVNDEIIDKYETYEELGEFMSGEIGLKRLVIMKLCGNPRYEEVFSNYEKTMKRGMERNRDDYEPHYLFIQNLKKL